MGSGGSDQKTASTDKKETKTAEKNSEAPVAEYAIHHASNTNSRSSQRPHQT
eukprot:gene38343-47338_t